MVYLVTNFWYLESDSAELCARTLMALNKCMTDKSEKAMMVTMENQLDFLWILKAVAIEIFFLIEFNSNLWYFASTGIRGENTTQRFPRIESMRWNIQFNTSLCDPLQGCEGKKN